MNKQASTSKHTKVGLDSVEEEKTFLCSWYVAQHQERRVTRTAQGDLFVQDPQHFIRERQATEVVPCTTSVLKSKISATLGQRDE